MPNMDWTSTLAKPTTKPQITLTTYGPPPTLTTTPFKLRCSNHHERLNRENAEHSPRRVQLRPRDELQPNYVLTHVHFQDPSNPTKEQVRDALKEKERVTIVEPEEQDPTTDLPTVSGMPFLRIELNRDQQQLMDRMAVYFQCKASGSDPHPEVLLLYGGPGIGKTHIIFALNNEKKP